MYRAAREVVQDVDPNETKRTIQLPTIFPQIYDYPGIPDLKGNKIIDIAPQTPRNPSDVYLSTTQQSFDLSKQQPSVFGSSPDMFTVLWNNGVKTLRINTNSGLAPTVVSNADIVTGNGTWSAGGVATALTTDNQNFYAGSGSLMFNLSAGANPSTGNLVNSTLSPLNLSQYWGQWTFYLETYMPIPADITSVTFQIGSSASNYYSLTATTTQQSTAFQTGWNLLAFSSANFAPTGAPNNAALTYVNVTWTTNGAALFGMRLNNIVAQIGFTLNCTYYSKYLFQNAQTLAFQETISDNSNFVNLDTDAVNLWLYKTAELATQQQQGLDALSFDNTYFQGEYERALAQYKQQYKSEIQLQQTTYYRMPPKGYNNYIGQGARY